MKASHQGEISMTHPQDLCYFCVVPLAIMSSQIVEGNQVKVNIGCQSPIDTSTT